MFVKEILPDLPQAIGNCTNDYSFRRLTDAVRLLTNKEMVDSQIGEIAVCVCGGFVTLPPEVQTPMGITVDGVPAIIRDEWFVYHINGPGDTGYTPFSFTDVLGRNYPTIRDPAGPVKLAATIRAASDSNKQLRIFGYDAEGTRIMTTGPDGPEDGFLVPTVFGRTLVNSDVPAIAKIERVYKDTTDDMVDLLAIDPATNEATSLLGRYRPYENTPSYVRIRVPNQEVVRVKFKRHVFEIHDQYDWLPVENRQALIHAVRSVKFRLDGKYDNGNQAEELAVRLMREDTNSNRPAGIHPPQVINNELPRETAGSSMFYGRGRWSGNGGYGYS